MSQAIALLALWLLFGTFTFGIGFIAFPILYWLLAIKGREVRAAKAQQKLQGTLMKDEKLMATAIQKRIAALLLRRQLVAITSSRIITLSRSWFGGFTMRDYQWKDLRDARLEENILPNLFGSKLTFVVGANQPQLLINGIPNEVAAQIYSHAQGEEQAWEEKRRVRALEEARAVSGGVTITSGLPGLGGAGSAGVSIMDELGKAKALFDASAISDVEYNEIKAKILARG